MGRGQKQRWPGAHKPPWQEPSLQPVEEEASVWGVRLQWQPCSLHITQQQQFASMAWQTFSMSIPGCGTPQSIHSSQHPECAPECRHPSQTGARRAVAQTICVGLKLSCLPQAGCCILLWVSLLLLLFFFFFWASLLSQLIFLLIRGLPHVRDPPLIFTSPEEHKSPPASSPLPLTFFL